MAIQVVLASHNPGKAKEYDAMLSPYGYEVVTADRLGVDSEKAMETSDTFEGNSLIKAKYVFDALEGKAIVLADDSGIRFDALNGFPGVHSARFNVNGDFSYPAKMAAINAMIGDNPNRNCQFVCVITLIDSNGIHQFKGVCQGIAAKTPVSKPGEGFGYDPMFYCPALGKTFGEASLAEKDKVSHRGIATRKLIDYLAHRK